MEPVTFPIIGYVGDLPLIDCSVYFLSTLWFEDIHYHMNSEEPISSSFVSVGTPILQEWIDSDSRSENQRIEGLMSPDYYQRYLFAEEVIAFRPHLREKEVTVEEYIVRNGLRTAAVRVFCLVHKKFKCKLISPKLYIDPGRLDW